MRPDQIRPSVITLTGPKTFVFSFLLQRVDGGGITSSPGLTIIQNAVGKTQALQDATKMALADRPDFAVIDWDASNSKPTPSPALPLMEKQPQVSVQGTTLEVLAPFLPYGIDLEWKGWNGKDEFLPCRAKFHALSQQHARVIGHAWALPLADCLPVLRPFSALTEPLEDGTVPAVEVAKLAYNYPETPHFDKLFALQRLEIKVFKSEVEVQISTGLGCVITSNYKVFWQDSTSTPASNQVAIVDYLRSKHFALPVNGRPLVEGIDYIKKVAPPTKEQKPGAGEAQSL